MAKQKYMTDIKLGERYYDPQTEVEGTATVVTFYQYGCERVTLETVDNGGQIKEYHFDAPRLEDAKTGKRAATTRTGGTGDPVPRQGAARR